MPPSFRKSSRLDHVSNIYGGFQLFSAASSSKSQSDNVKHLTRTDVRKMKVAELRNELENRGITTTGLRKELVDKLLNSLQDKKKSPKDAIIKKQHNDNDKAFSPDNLYVLRFYGESNHVTVSASCGVVLYDSETSKVEWEGRMYLGNGESAQEAEYIGLKKTLPLIYAMGVRKLIIQGIHKSTAVNHLQGNYQVKVKHMERLFRDVHNFINNELEYCEVWGIQSDQNRKAKSLAKKAMDMRSSDGFNNSQNLEQSDMNKSILTLDKTLSETTSEEIWEEDVPLAYKVENKDEEVKYDDTKDNEDKNQRNNDGLTLPVLSPDKVYVLQFDGGSRGNPGVSGAGIVLFDSESQLEVWSAHKYLNVATNNVAEYTGLLEGLKLAKAMGVKHLIAEGDSKLVVNQINGVYKVKKDHLIPLYQEALAISKQFRSFHLGYIPRAENSRADQLANVAMDYQTSSCIVVSNESIEQEKQSLVVNPNHSLDRNNNEPRTELRNKNETDQKGMIEIPYPSLSNIQVQAYSNEMYHLRFCISSSLNMHGAGIGLYDGNTGGKIWTGRYFIPEQVSSNIATYIAAIIGLRCALSFGAKKIIVEGKSDLIINQMKGKFKVKSENLIPYHLLASEMSQEFDLFDIIQLKDNTCESELKSESRRAIKYKRSEL